MKEKTENYQQLGVIRFRKELSDRRWWINFSDLAALIPFSQGFDLETWLGNREGLDDLIATDGDKFWGVYAITVELSRILTADPFRGLPVWVVRRMKISD